MPLTLPHLLAEAPPPPDRLFLETPDGVRLTYGDFDKRVAQFARALSELGVRPGDRVAVQVEKSPEALLIPFACFRMGAVYLPLNTAYTPTEVGGFVEDADPALIVCRPDDAMSMGDLGGGQPRVATLDTYGGGTLSDLANDKADTFAQAEIGEDDLAALLYTSGTTGRSKGAMLTHANLASNAGTLRDLWHFTSDDVLLHALPIYHTHGLFVATNVMLLAGGGMIFLERFDIDQVISAFPRATSMMGVPTFYTRLLDDPRFDRDLVRHMRLFISGSAPLLAQTHDAFRDRTGHAILERYGMTETGMNTSNPYDGDRIAGTVGFPLPDVDLRVADPDTGAELAQGETGVIEVRGPNVFKGYWGMPDKTAEEFRDDGFFITGDLGLIDDRGYVHIVGRAKDLIITGGLNVYPKEIEIALDALPGVLESAVIGVPHPDFGEAVTAIVVPEPGADIDKTSIVTALANRLARFKQPKHVIITDQLPRNTMGKVQKNLLRESHRELFSD